MDSEGLKKRAIVIIWNDRNPFTFSDIAYSGSFLNVARYYENLKGTHGKKVFTLPMGNDGLNIICKVDDRYCIEELIIIDHGNLKGSQLIQGQEMEKLGSILQTLSDKLCDSTNIPIRIKLLGCGAGQVTSPDEIPPTAQKLLDMCTINSEGKPRRVQVEAYPGIVNTFDSPVPRKEQARGLKRFPNPKK
ncbi:MAG: hypothetical protein Q4C70_12720 [Planctomycetia bacterium]|nr:hypothetical protein [Planctomycetia bacterium]